MRPPVPETLPPAPALEPDAETDSDHGLPVASSASTDVETHQHRVHGPVEPDREPTDLRSSWGTEVGLTLATITWWSTNRMFLKNTLILICFLGMTLSPILRTNP